MYINDQRGFREYGMMDVGLIWGGRTEEEEQ
jgi:hypothetical protein